MLLIRTYDDNRVMAFYQNPDQLTTEQKQGTIEVASLPAINNTETQIGRYFYDPQTNEVYVKYFNRPIAQ